MAEEYDHGRRTVRRVKPRPSLALRFCRAIELVPQTATNGRGVMRLAMHFIEMTGRTLLRVIDESGPSPDDLAEVGVTDDSIVRINREGDIELRRVDRWDVIGGLLGDFEHRVKSETGLGWASPIATADEESEVV